MTGLPAGRIRAIFFDLDDTLLDSRESTRVSAEAALRLAEDRYGRPLEALRIRFEEVLPAAIRRYGLWALPLQELRRRCFAETLRAFGIEDADLCGRMADLYGRQREQSAELFPEVEGVLARLHGSYVLGIVSDGLEELHGRIIRRLRLDRFVQHVLLGADVGLEKPDPRIFEMAVARAGCDPSEALYVGDSLVRDIAGAQAAGLRSIWINRSRAGDELTPVRPDYEIASLTGLLELLAGLERPRTS